MVALVLVVLGWSLLRPPKVVRPSPEPAGIRLTVAVETARPARAVATEERVGDSASVDDAVPAQWRRLRSAPVDDGLSKQLIQFVEKLAERDPAQARQLAAGEPDADLRRELWRAVIRGWARTDLGLASDWVRRQDNLPSSMAISELVFGARERPGAVVAFLQQVRREQPERSHEMTGQVVRVLGHAGDHERAAAFAAQNDEENTGIWLTAAYKGWGYHEPESAVLSALDLADARQRGRAFRAAISGWAQVDPQGLAEMAQSFPAGPEQRFALRVVASIWEDGGPMALAEPVPAAGQ